MTRLRDRLISGAFAVAGAGRGHRLGILTFHRVHERVDPMFPLEPDGARFNALVGMLARGFRLMTLSQGVAALRDGRLPARALVITFDDGYRDNAEVALPILCRHGAPATFFVCPGFLDGSTMWNDLVIEALRRCTAPLIDLDMLGLGRHMLAGTAERRNVVNRVLAAIKHRPAPERNVAVQQVVAAAGGGGPNTTLMMSPAQLRELARAGMEIGAHTVTHPILCALPDDLARQELAESRSQLQALVDQPVEVLAYPNGRPLRDYDSRHVGLARELGFRFAVTTAPGWATDTDDPLQLPRLAPWGRSPAGWVARLWRSAWVRAPAAVT